MRTSRRTTATFARPTATHHQAAAAAAAVTEPAQTTTLQTMSRKRHARRAVLLWCLCCPRRRRQRVSGSRRAWRDPTNLCQRAMATFTRTPAARYSHRITHWIVWRIHDWPQIVCSACWPIWSHRPNTRQLLMPLWKSIDRTSPSGCASWTRALTFCSMDSARSGSCCNRFIVKFSASKRSWSSTDSFPVWRLRTCWTASPARFSTLVRALPMHTRP